MVTLPKVWPPVFMLCWVVDVETKSISEVAGSPSVYVQLDDGKTRALLFAPAVASPMLNVTPALWVMVPV